MEFEAISGSLFSSMLFILFLYVNYQVIVTLSIGEMIASMSRMEKGVLPLILSL